MELALEIQEYIRQANTIKLKNKTLKKKFVYIKKLNI